MFRLRFWDLPPHALAYLRLVLNLHASHVMGGCKKSCIFVNGIIIESKPDNDKRDRHHAVGGDMLDDGMPFMLARQRMQERCDCKPRCELVCWTLFSDEHIEYIMQTLQVGNKDAREIKNQARNRRLAQEQWRQRQREAAEFINDG